MERDGDGDEGARKRRESEEVMAAKRRKKREGARVWCEQME